MLTVTTAATDRSLLTLAEIQAATGTTSTSDTAALNTLNARVAASIARACNVAADGVTPPTLRLETLTEVFRPDLSSKNLVLARRPVVSITSAVEDGTTLDTDEYETEKGAGLFYRLSDDTRSLWAAAKITVVYTAGWSTVPDDLKTAAAKFARILWTEDGPDAREPGLKSHSVDGVGERTYWVSPNDEPLMSKEILELLGPYTNRCI